MKAAHAHAAFKSEVVEIANAVGKALTGDFAQVRELIDANEIVFAVWTDPEEPDGVGMLIVKGVQVLREISASGQPLATRYTAIPCVEGAQALALREVVGQPDRRH